MKLLFLTKCCDVALAYIPAVPKQIYSDYLKLFLLHCCICEHIFILLHRLSCSDTARASSLDVEAETSTVY